MGRATSSAVDRLLLHTCRDRVMGIHFTSASMHPAIASDRAFFAAHPRRRFRARRLWSNETGFIPNITMFAASESGEACELNLVILVRFAGGRYRYHFVHPAIQSLNSDIKIEAFLRSRGISLPGELLGPWT